MNNEPHRCPSCHSAYGSDYDLKRHMTLAHREEIETMDVPRNANVWSDDDKRRLRQNAHLGVTALTKLLGRSRGAISGQAFKLGIHLGKNAEHAEAPTADPAVWDEPETATPDPLEELASAIETVHLTDNPDGTLEDDDAEPEAWAPRRCRVCGCTDFNACTDDDGRPCHWVEDDLCSACVAKAHPVEITLVNNLEPLASVARAEDTRLELIRTYARLAIALVRYGSVEEMDDAEAALDRIKELAS